MGLRELSCANIIKRVNVILVILYFISILVNIPIMKTVGSKLDHLQLTDRDLTKTQSETIIIFYACACCINTSLKIVS